jgi:hypothetical protein
MASSISSEHAFSLAGITISKCRSRLKPNIIEALQFLKCLHHQKLIYQEKPSMILELQMESAAQKCIEESGKPKGWDDLIGDLEDNKGFSNCDNEVFVQGV